MPKWAMDTELAEKLVELGSLKSALEIYERLEQWTDAAVCYAQTGLTRDYEKVLEHQYDCLCANPIDFENWYFYGCVGLEIKNYNLAAEAFTRCVTNDETSTYAWSNLAAALIELDKMQEAFNALKRAVDAGDKSKRSWRIWENYLIVAVTIGNWDEVLYASRVLLNIRDNEGSLDIPIMEKLVDLLVSQQYEESNQSFFQKSCIEFVCKMVPQVVNHNARVWRIIARVDFWRGKPWLALEDYEKAYRAVTSSPDLITDEGIWNEAVESCHELVSAYENFGELPGKYGAGDVICKDWKFKAKSTVRSLISKGKATWEYSDGFERLQELKKEVMSNK
ncbi:unnamed protein product [Ambrosiozyma monospora]|uniref:Unnamed protein product n=1 Tax=Ambrosiozyma monospora TaxID=43982 RepID=A0ACB5U1N5_AMBMO|nr:unnamed protein product [Ambrosiozyma monospora]